MNRLVLLAILYAWAHGVYARAILEIDDIHQINISSPYLFYRFPDSKDTAWKPFRDELSTIAPLTPFEVMFSFRCGPEESIVFEWPDNKIEDLDALVTNSKGDTCARLVFRDIGGYRSELYVKNQIMILYHPVQGEVYTLQYRLNSHNPPYTVLWVLSLQSFINRYLREYTWYGLFAGIVLSVFAINLLFFLSQRETIFLWYTLYTLSLGVFHWAYTGVGFQWLWPDQAIWNRYSYMVASFLLLSFQYIYMYSFTRQLNPLRKGYVIAVISIRLIILIITLVNPSFSRWHLFLDFITIAFQLWLSWRVSLHKTIHGSLYMFSISLLVGCYLIFIASYYGFITASFYVYNSIAVGGICELIVGMVALSLRYKYISDERNKLQQSEITSLKAIGDLKEKVLEETKEKERIQREVNKDLEIKIQERTTELAQKNEKLEELNAKLLEMSSQLDKQNWSLNKELQVDRMKLMWGKDISYDEFKQNFPSDKHILRFIAELKWQDGFVCKKCQHTGYVDGIQYLSRKCIQCKYEESVTAHTLFHGVKFPLVQALYISLHTVIHRETVPIKQLAEDIDLREATVWAFRKKTMERITSKHLNKGDVLRSLVG